MKKNQVVRHDMQNKTNYEYYIERVGSEFSTNIGDPFTTPPPPLTF